MSVQKQQRNGELTKVKEMIRLREYLENLPNILNDREAKLSSMERRADIEKRIKRLTLFWREFRRVNMERVEESREG